MTTVAPPAAAVLLTGDELLQGRVSDTNGPFLSASLIEAGFSVHRLLVVADDPAEIAAALRWLLAAGTRLIVVSGGLGTTHDDVTMATVAEVLERPLIRHEDAWRHVRERVREVAARRRLDAAELEAQAARQALLPRGARCVTPAGLAPGAVIDAGASSVVVLPGVPRELETMWPRLLEELAAGLPRPRVRLLRVHGVGEMQVIPIVESVPRDGLEVGITAGYGEIVIRIAAYDDRAERRADVLAERLSDELPVFSTDGRTLDELVAESLRRRRATVAVAESCTGGLLGARLTTLPGSSDYFVGGVLSYSDRLKERLLGVPLALLRRHGAVSAPVAEAMAAGVRSRTGAGYALAVTGIAGPGGGSAEKPVGLVYVACAAPQASTVAEHRLPGGRAAVRDATVTAAMHALRRSLDERP
jgi:nicotinamide-nucleotide amidase